MLTHPTLDQLHTLGLHGIANGFKDLAENAEARSLEHAEWLGLLLEYEVTLRRQKRFEMRVRSARPASRTPAIAPSTTSTARSISSSPLATGSATSAICSSPALSERLSLTINVRSAASARVG